MAREKRCCRRLGSFAAGTAAGGGCTQLEKGSQLRPTGEAGARKASEPRADLLLQSEKLHLKNDSRNRNEHH